MNTLEEKTKEIVEKVKGLSETEAAALSNVIKGMEIAKTLGGKEAQTEGRAAR